MHYCTSLEITLYNPHYALLPLQQSHLPPIQWRRSVSARLYIIPVFSPPIHGCKNKITHRTKKFTIAVYSPGGRKCEASFSHCFAPLRTVESTWTIRVGHIMPSDSNLTSHMHANGFKNEETTKTFIFRRGSGDPPESRFDSFVSSIGLFPPFFLSVCANLSMVHWQITIKLKLIKKKINIPNLSTIYKI